MTGALEIVSVVLIALPATRIVGLMLGPTIVAVAILTVVRKQDLLHLAPFGALVALSAPTAIFY
ncbi:hypothetical protein JQ617_14850 [Bradyrhizobium sp. KB893862 SZCCT0404]|uniref:hypothetical protein n=1 Tax=Bradyrhizobium sp. KB893862 SZCCT0404 TaxID=2807672 RepID=UPI001BA5D292|nr:hypothetical protein [Bradyrhizobium sp. KB893862 SZCCT0404]MBR1175246.1 hypothetical protein [Bradyrhizobium sp. KB893862 SZCCT0404]